MLIVGNICKCRCKDRECSKWDTPALFMALTQDLLSFKNLSQFAKTGYKLIRQVNATARQKGWRRNTVGFLFDLCMFCPNNLVK